MSDTSDTTNYFILVTLLLAPIAWAYHLFFRSKNRRIDKLEEAEREIEAKKDESIEAATDIAEAEREESTRIYNAKEKRIVDELEDRYVEAQDPDAVNKFLKEVGQKVRGKDE